MRKLKLFTFLLALVTCLGSMWATENSIVINGTPQVGDNSISLTYYFDPANVPGITGYAPTLKVKCVTDNKWDEMWLSLSEPRSGTETINLNTLGEFEAGKSYEVCFAYYNGSWVDDVFQSFTPAASTPAVIDLATITSDYVIPDGATLTGTLQNNVVLTVADNATITLNNVDINWDKTWTGGDHAGITCENAIIILAECTTNKIRGFLDGNPGVYVRPEKTITIQGTGTLYAATNGGAAAIGGGYGAQNSNARDGGNIVILNGTIFATGGNLGAGIGSGGRAKVGNITIQGGIITATGGGSAAGIGCGQTKQSDWKAQCGNITITNGVKYLKATKGSGAAHSIGKGNNSGIAVCGTVTINGTTGAISTSPYTYSPAADNVKNLINAIGSVAYTQACKDKIDAARAAYEALADYSCDVDAVNALKDAVSNYSTLTAAEAAYNTLVANAVIDKINAIGSPITAADQTAIEDARAAYNALTDTQKGYVTNYSELTDAEAVLAVVNLINAIDDPVTASSQTAIDAARNAYDALTGDQQALVGNYATLTDAEAAYAALTPSADPTIFAGFTVTDGCGGFDGEDHTKLVDGKFTSGNEGVDWTKWCADSQHKSVPSGESESCWWVDFYAENPIAVTGYILTTGNDNIPHGAGRNPSSWIIKAKLNESDSWTTIATVSNDNTMQIVNFTDFAFTLDQAGTYKYFRFMVSTPVSGTCMQLCELRFTNNGGSTPKPPFYALLLELYNALGEDVWTGYGVNTGVISYKRGSEPNSFNASFMGGTYSFDLPFESFTEVSKVENTDGSYTYTLVVNLPAQTGMGTETLHVTVKNGEITEMDSENAGIEMQKEEGPVTGWAALQAAMNDGGVIKLGANVIAEGGDAALTIPSDKTVVLELNGFTINRNLNAAVENGSVIVNNGTLAILGEGVITGGKTTGNGGGVLNNGIFTLYGGEITGNVAAIGGGVYNNGGAQGFWMTGGLIDGNSASSYPAIGGEVIFNSAAVIQINADGAKVSIDEALADMATYSYIKPVMPDYDDYTTEVAITANEDPNNTGIYYSTFYDRANKYMLPAGVEAYVADLSGSDLVLTKIAVAGQVIPADEAVILRASVQNFSLLPSFEAPVSVSTNNDLEGVDVETAVTSIEGLTRENCYVLSGTPTYGVGFYLINSDNLKAHKAYVKFTPAPGQGNAPKRMRFVFNTTTGVEAVTGYGLQVTGQKVIENGVLYIIKNGVRYNVQGQIVK